MKRKYLWLIVALYVLFICSNSLQSGEVSGGISEQVTRIIVSLLGHVGIMVRNFDLAHLIVRKLAHFSEFALLGILVCFANRKQPLFSNDLYALALFLLVPLLDEGIQLFVPGRAGVMTDVLIDTSGYLTGWLVSGIKKNNGGHL